MIALKKLYSVATRSSISLQNFCDSFRHTGVTIFCGKSNSLIIFEDILDYFLQFID